MARCDDRSCEQGLRFGTICLWFQLLCECSQERVYTLGCTKNAFSVVVARIAYLSTKSACVAWESRRNWARGSCYVAALLWRRLPVTRIAA